MSLPYNHSAQSNWIKYDICNSITGIIMLNSQNLLNGPSHYLWFAREALVLFSPRHIHKVLRLSARMARALAWLFKVWCFVDSFFGCVCVCGGVYFYEVVGRLEWSGGWGEREKCWQLEHHYSGLFSSPIWLYALLGSSTPCYFAYISLVFRLSQNKKRINFCSCIIPMMGICEEFVSPARGKKKKLYRRTANFGFLRLNFAV